ncbi:MAG TPA: MBL fold metallo-hydrolase [Blastocatellia bacterium]|jgi:phosphoribosyl 1,2-cyclic phosphodiesterase
MRAHFGGHRKISLFQMRVCILASGSSGNATLIVAGGARVLVDCGLSARETIRRVQAVGEDPARLDAIVITHEHSDHMRGLLALSKTLDTRVYISDAALEACNLGEKEKFIRRGAAISSSQDFEVGAFRFSPFAIPHDAADPMAFTVEANGVKMGIAVDLGYIDAPAAAALRGSDVLIIEANHEVEMLRACTFYPWALKQRIMSRRGHTSNDEMARFLREDFDDKAEHIVLAHLSRNTNHPAIARLAAVQALEARSPLFSANAEKRVKVARHDGPSDWIEL